MSRQLLTDLCDATPEEAALGLAMRELESTSVPHARLARPTQAAKHVGMSRVEVLEVVKVEPLDEDEPRCGALRLRHCDRAVQLDDGGAGQPSRAVGSRLRDR